MDWPHVRLGDVAQEFISGGTPSTKVEHYWTGDIPWITGADVTDNVVVSGRRWITQEAIDNSATHVVPKGAILLVTRTGVGKVAIAGADIAISQDLTGIVLKEGMNADFVVAAIRQKTRNLLDIQQGAIIKGVLRKDVEKLEIPLPPLSEQRRIVDILDQAERIRRRRADADAKADRILPALFIKMFGDPRTNPRGLPIIELGEVISEGPQNGLYKPASSYGKGTKILRIDGFYSGEVSNLDGLKRLKVAPEEIAKYGLEESDIVVNRVNSEEYLGKSAIIPALSEPVVFESNMMRFTVDTLQVLPGFVVAHLQTSFTKAEILSKAKRAINQASINQQDVRSLTILLPPLADQERFVIASSKIRTLLSRSESERVKLEMLFDALIHRAFSGNITASWREAHKKELLQEMERQATAIKKNYRGIRQ